MRRSASCKETMKKLLRIQIALLLAGCAFFTGGWTFGKVRKGVVADGVAVGGLTYAEAAETVRRSYRDEPFIVHTPEGDELFETEYTDDLDELLRAAKRGEEVHATRKRVWVNAEEELSSLCARHSFAAADATLSFSARGFSYTREKAGRACDLSALLCDVFDAMERGESEASLTVLPVRAEITEEDLRGRTRPLASYTTYFDASNSPRAHNIALAASRITGTVLGPGEEFSFNAAVGKRTRENGFEEANIISGGEFIPGVGGGVCQASTTLMNAALLAGLKVTESRPHSLTVGYVPPSRDAMVSEYSDLKFINPYPEPVYCLGLAGGGKVRFTFYGLPDGRRYEVESKVLLTAAPPPEKIVEGEENRVLRAPKAGVASESYLLVYRGDELLRRTLLRRDTYAVVQGIRQVKPPEEPETPSDGTSSSEPSKTLDNPPSTEYNINTFRRRSEPKGGEL